MSFILMKNSSFVITYIFRVFVILFLSFVLFAPFLVLAQDFPGESLGEGSAPGEGLVPCGTEKYPAGTKINNVDVSGQVSNPCQACHIFVLGQNILNFIWWYISIPIATLALIYSGFLMIIPTASTDRLTKGRRVLTNTFIGIGIVFFAWLGIDTIIKVVAGQNLTSGQPAEIKGYGPWNKVECRTIPVSTYQPRTTSGSTASPSTGSIQSRVCSGCVSLSAPKGPNTCKDQAAGQTCQVNSILNQKLYDLNERIVNDGKLNYWRVTEAWPPTITHQNICHQSGTCVDANFTGSSRGSAQEIKYFIQQSQNVELRAVYEVATESRRQELISGGVPASNIQVVARITGEHFSVYLTPQ